MAKNSGSKGFNGWPGRRTARDFDRTVSPMGENVEETPSYSPSRTVEGGASETKGGRASQSESARDQRRGG
jgi:hypothetical protein